MTGGQSGKADDNISRRNSPIQARKMNDSESTWVLFEPPQAGPTIGSKNTTSALVQANTPSERIEPNKKDLWSFNIDIGNQRQHIGAWYGTFIRDDIKDAVNKLCNHSKKRGAGTCSTKNESFYVEYSNRQAMIERTKSVLVHIASDNIPEEYGTALRQAFIDQIADVFMIATVDDKNCYRWDRTKQMCLFCDLKMCMAPAARGRQPDTRGRIVRWCNAPEYVKVALADKEGQEKAHMKVELDFQYPMDQGKFDCMGIIDTVDRNARENRQEALRGVLKSKTINTVVVCPEKEVTGSCPGSDCLYKEGGCRGK
ncbi:hypothetical protein FB567DRAFT_589266 [Paraphoma chrysanthemicola]|uniref:Uncharacterized protein n=1 Tax=Paraphoma chrysanthemicola TaxID=798071 RepID=A0A8K0RF25_9PLEO|nr:hypothetical protein FB567DRAFT_589266 [Paraphoma chrysanthemicola]